MTTLDHINELVAIIRRRLVWILLLSALVAVASFIYHRSIKNTYSTYAKIFPLSINNSSGGSSLQSLKAQFGVMDKSDLDKIYNVIELVNSKNVSLKVVQQQTNNPKFPRIADWLMDDHNTNLRMFQKPIQVNRKDSINYFYAARDLLLANTTVSSEKTEFYSITTTAHNTDLAQAMNEAILQQLSTLYVNMTTEKPRSDLNKIRTMRDSLNAELTAVERAIAGYRDSTQFASRVMVNVPQRKLERTRAEIEQLYANTATAYQNAKFKLLSESPIFQILDKPGEPFSMIQEPAKKKAVTHGILAFIVSSLLFAIPFFWKLVRQELSRI